MKVLPAALAKWIPGPLHCLGTDGFGRSDSRELLRDFFEVDARYIVIASLLQLAMTGNVEMKLVKKAMQEMQIKSDKLNPHTD